MSELYYTPPTDKAFKEMKKAAIKVWMGYDHGADKVDQIKDIKNVGDNFMYILAMFDVSNQRIVIADLSTITKLAVRHRLESGGAAPEHLLLMGLLKKYD